MGSWGSFLDNLLNKLPIQGRVERWKNEKDNLIKEEAALEKLNLNINNAEDRKKAKRLSDVRARIKYLNQLLGNKATD
jgi:hypothetical protein